MLRTTLRTLRAHPFRLVATALAVVLGVGFVAGTLIFGDTVRAATYDQFARAASNVDVSVESDLDLPGGTVDTVRAVPGVAAAEGRMERPLPLLDRRGKLVDNGMNPGITISAGTEPRLRPYDIAAGRAPAAAGEAALDVATADRTEYRIGDQITVLDQDQDRRQLTLVGTADFGAARQYADQSVVLLTDGGITALTGADQPEQVVAVAAASVDESELARRVAAAVPADLRVRTGAEYRYDLADAATGQLGPFLTILLVFAGIACVVAAFVIYNTFTILIAQRIRELALLRCVGASRRQVFGSVLLESAVVGLVGALIGIGVGVLVAIGLFGGANAVGAELPAHPPVVTVTPVLVAVLVGVLVTVVAALLPAVRSTRVAPLAALRGSAAGDVTPTRRRVLLIAAGTLVAVPGSALTWYASNRVDDSQTATVLVVAGGLANFLAVLIVSPLFVGPLTAALGWLPGRVFGTPVKLASANARRNPGRAAATTAALMIGVGLMSAATVAVNTVQRTADHELAANYPFDFLVRSQILEGESGVPAEVADRLRAEERLSSVTQVRIESGVLDGDGTRVGTLDDEALATLNGPELVAGSLRDLTPGRVVLFTGGPGATGRDLGDQVTVTGRDGRQRVLTVAGLAEGRSNTGDVLVRWSDFEGLYPDARQDDLVMVRAADGVSPADSRAVVESVTDDYPLTGVQSLAVWRDQITQAVEQLITVVAALLAVAIIIALIGIMNTLSLSVLERTRESAVVRALGLTRTQLRLTLLVEALLMGVVGASVGIGFGLLYGLLTARVMFDGIDPIVTVPAGQLAGYVTLAAVAAVLAAVLPARRAARSSVVAAMSHP
ncbi:ABC transporter permease [Plantactinospora sp. GCM10030261]|uniref:ABC transporter permease n=1 Tax=Plantactinospora sp. GCM10030261 TaxID=3273420 RepID=UPI00360EB6E3